MVTNYVDATVVWMRRHRPEGTGLAAMVVRFSSVASVSLAAVIVAGLVMAWMVLESPGDLFGTEWGRVLMAKTAAVAVAAGMGAHNHFRLPPRHSSSGRMIRNSRGNFASVCRSSRRCS